MTKGFAPKQRPSNPIADAAQLLHAAAKKVNKPLVIPMFPPGNKIGLKPGQLKLGRDEILPSCDGIVVAIQCSAEDAQEVMDLIMKWQQQKVAGKGGV